MFKTVLKGIAVGSASLLGAQLAARLAAPKEGKEGKAFVQKAAPYGGAALGAIGAGYLVKSL